MNIITNNIYTNNLYFSGKTKPTSITNTFKRRNINSDNRIHEFITLRNVYNNLWAKLNLPENLKPRLQMKSMLFAVMCFSMDDYTIYINNRFKPFNMRVKNKTGQNESLLRHEIEHVTQFWDIVRLVGAKNVENEFQTNIKSLSLKITPSLLKKMKEIEQTFGKIQPNTKESKRAKEHLEGLRNYPNFDNCYNFFNFKSLKNLFLYNRNILERKANAEAKLYKPSFFKTCKINIQEFFAIFKSSK